MHQESKEDVESAPTAGFLIRVGVLWSWIATFAVGLAVYFLGGIGSETTFIVKCFLRFAGFILPQIGVMLGFFFRLERTAQPNIPSDVALMRLAAQLAVFYNIVFIVLLVFGVAFLWLGETFDDATNNMLMIMGAIGCIGSAPVTYMFSSHASTTRGKRRGKVGESLSAAASSKRHDKKSLPSNE